MLTHVAHYGLVGTVVTVIDAVCCSVVPCVGSVKSGPVTDNCY